MRARLEGFSPVFDEAREVEKHSYRGTAAKRARKLQGGGVSTTLTLALEKSARLGEQQRNHDAQHGAVKILWKDGKCVST